ncbi:transcription termination factor Rho [Thalassoroseus pseudoceratinae]|uniref:transcription termination factor Rho n=1 Tax=Thalassoroseus pseudoceratinae TaxID=2713176 RepID=UPI001F11162F|nr:transcription termination factor Rho [Thalassoroseus pseudoceratinae]
MPTQGSTSTARTTRRRVSRKKSTAEDTVNDESTSAETENAESSLNEDSAAEETKKSKSTTTRRRRTTRKKAEAEPEPTADDGATETDDFGAGIEPEPKTKTRRRRTKAMTTKASTTKTRTRKSAKTKAEEPEADEPKAEAVESPPVEPVASAKEESAEFVESQSESRQDEVQSSSESDERSSSADTRPPRNSDDESGGRRRRRRRRRRSRDNDNQNSGGSHNSRGNRGRSRTTRTRSYDQSNEDITGTIEGVLELHPKNYGFLRSPEKNYSAQDSDAFVSSSFIDKHGLREGVLIRGEVGPGTKGQGPRLKSIETIDGRTIEEYQKIRHFDELTPVNPFEQIRLETGPRPITMRVMDLLTPIGKGQRALLVAPPRSGKTMLLHDIAAAVSENHPEMKLMVLLIDERPEEVTEIRRSTNGEVIASSMDREVESHIRVSQLLIERAKRLAEAGGEVFVLLDSITRTARAFNKWVGNSGRTGTGGLDVKAMDIPRKIFGTARRFEEGGSLTILATALIDTGSRMDDAIFQEFKGTGNMEAILSRDLADRRIWPALDIGKSGTRREEKILEPETLDTVTLLRRSLVSLNPTEAMEELTRKLEMFPSNAEFLQKIRNVL